MVTNKALTVVGLLLNTDILEKNSMAMLTTPDPFGSEVLDWMASD